MGHHIIVFVTLAAVTNKPPQFQWFSTLYVFPSYWTVQYVSELVGSATSGPFRDQAAGICEITLDVSVQIAEGKGEWRITREAFLWARTWEPQVSPSSLPLSRTQAHGYRNYSKELGNASSWDPSECLLSWVERMNFPLASESMSSIALFISTDIDRINCLPLVIMFQTSLGDWNGRKYFIFFV